MTLPLPAIPLQPADELVRSIVAAGRAEPIITALLFPGWAPARLGDLDDRFYAGNVELPQDPNIRGTLPRVLIETTQMPFMNEQKGFDVSEVAIYSHVLCPKDREEHAKTLDAYVGRWLVSTPFSTVRIITASLSLDGLRRIGRSSGFDDAWEIVTQYRSPFVGVTA